MENQERRCIFRIKICTKKLQLGDGKMMNSLRKESSRPISHIGMSAVLVHGNASPDAIAETQADSASGAQSKPQTQTRESKPNASTCSEPQGGSRAASDPQPAEP